MECCSGSISILDGRSWTTHHQKCHRMSIHSFLLQQLSTATTEPARRNTIWSDEERPLRPSDPHLWHSSTPDNNSLHGGAEPPLLVQHHMNYHHMSTPSTDESFQDAKADDDFSTAPLDDTIWLEDAVLDRHLCIHEQSQLNYQCSYPCPYRLDLPHSSPEDATAPYYELMDLSDISDIQDVMTITSDETSLIWKTSSNKDYGLHKNIYSLNSLHMD